MTTILEELSEKQIWQHIYDSYSERNFVDKNKQKEYLSIINNFDYERIADSVLKETFKFDLARKHQINKIDSQKKKDIYIFPYRDEMLLKVIASLLSKHFSMHIAANCHSFQKQRGAKTAFRWLLNRADLSPHFCLKLDIRNFFNSIDPTDFLKKLPDAIRSDGVLYRLLQQLLLNEKVLLEDGKLIADKKGLMAGTPIAPFLSNFYLKTLDDYFWERQILYVRYSDDIIVFGNEVEVKAYAEKIENYLQNIGLELNTEKTKIYPPHTKWHFLGFSYCCQTIDISENALAKMKGKIRRLAALLNRKRMKNSWSIEKTSYIFIRRLNKKFYGIQADQNELCWARWFFPLLNTNKTLHILDRFVQDKIRFAATGHHRKLNYKQVPYSLLRKINYLPLQSAYFMFKTDFENYEQMVLAKLRIK